MSKKIIAVGIIAVAIAGFCFHYWSDKEVIKREMLSLATEISKTKDETPIPMALKMAAIKKRLTSPCTVIIPERHYTQPLEQDLVIRYLMYYRQQYQTIDLRFTDLVIDIPQKNNGLVHTTVHILRQANTALEEVDEELHPMQFTLIKKDKKWRIQNVTVPQALTL